MTTWRSAAARRIKELTKTKSVDAAAIEIGRRLTEGQRLPPTNLAMIFPRVNIHSCYPDPDLMIAGELRKADDGLEIAYSESETVTRQRFTIAHEIAHAVFERTGSHCPRRGSELEKLCDMIASQILVPQSTLSAEVRSQITLSEIRRLAKRFETSLTMMAIRCASQFPMLCAQAEGGEILWQAGTKQIGLQRPMSQLKRLLQLIEEDATGHKPCSLDLINGLTLEGTLEWQATGDERLLLLVTRRS